MQNKEVSKILAGIIAGAVVGVLFAPKSGKETRQDIQKMIESMRSELLEKIEKIENFSKEAYQSSVGKVVSGYESAKKITPEEAAEVKKILEESFEKIEKTLKSNGK